MATRGGADSCNGTAASQRVAYDTASPHAGTEIVDWDARFNHKINRYNSPKAGSSTGSISSQERVVSASQIERPSLLDQFVSPTYEEFMRDYYGRKPVIIKTKIDLDNGAGSVVAGNNAVSSIAAGLPNDWVGRTATIAAYAATVGKPKGRVAVVDPGDKERKRANPEYEAALQEGTKYTKAEERLSAVSKAINKLSKKFLVAVRDPHTDNADIELLRQQYIDLFHCCVTTNLYLSGDSGSVGFVEHHDNHDVFAIQLQGAKRWYVGKPILNFPSARYLKLDDHNTCSADLEAYDTIPGSILYMPVGWRHYAIPAKKADSSAGVVQSVHVTMGIQVPRWIDAFEGLLKNMGGSIDWLREPLPVARLEKEGIEEGLKWDVSELDSKCNALADALKESIRESKSIRTALGTVINLSSNESI